MSVEIERKVVVKLKADQGLKPEQLIEFAQSMPPWAVIQLMSVRGGDSFYLEASWMAKAAEIIVRQVP